MDWSVYHSINVFVAHHAWLGTLFKYVESVGVPLIAVATAALWLLARPGAGRKWKLAAASGLAAAGLALLVNQVIGHAIWHRARPYQAHHVLHLWTSKSHDPSFPSDHASAAFAIAFAILLYDRVAGGLFLALAVLIAGGRLVIGAHYLTDVLGGLGVGVACALVLWLARPLLELVIRLVERLTDPLLAPLWRLARR